MVLQLIYFIHPDTRGIKEIPFLVTSNEGSILISCTTSLALGLIQPMLPWMIPHLELMSYPTVLINQGMISLSKCSYVMGKIKKQA